MSRPAHRLFSSSLRSSTRVCLNRAARSPQAALTRRVMSSQSHASHGSTQGDRPWLIGSALVFGPLFLYLVSPPARKSSHGHTDHGHENHRDAHEDKRQHSVPRGQENINPITDDEGTAVSSQEVKKSMVKAFEADSPKDAQEQEVAAEVVAKAEMVASEERSADPQAESSIDATPMSESEQPTLAPVEVGADEPTDATSDEKAQSVASDSDEGAIESKT